MRPHLRIESSGPTGKDVRGIWLDGKDISRWTHGVDLKMRSDGVTEVTLHVFVDRIDLDMNADVRVQAPLLRREESG